jgi:hypothetical protein
MTTQFYPQFHPRFDPQFVLNPPRNPPAPQVSSSVQCPVQPFFTGEKFRQKEKFNFLFFLKMKWFSRFSKSPELRENIIINHHIIYIFGFHCVARNVKGWLGFCSSYVVYSHIWLNLPMDDPHFVYNFLLMVTSLAKKQNKKQKILK